MRTITVYGISTCSTVKKARAWLDQRGHTHTWVDFRQTPPDPARVARWVAALGALKMRNLSGGAYRALGDEKLTWSAEQWTSAFFGDAMLVKRPIVEVDGVPVAVGFDEARFGELFGS